MYICACATYAGIGGVDVPFWYCDDDEETGAANGSNPPNIFNEFWNDEEEEADGNVEDWARLDNETTSKYKFTKQYRSEEPPKNKKSQSKSKWKKLDRSASIHIWWTFDD